MCATSDLPELMTDLKFLQEKYEIKEVHDACVVLGMRVTRSRERRELKLDQEVYVKKLLERFAMSEAKTAPTPCSGAVEQGGGEGGGEEGRRGGGDRGCGECCWRQERRGGRG
jgi:hypothetical protein